MAPTPRTDRLVGLDLARGLAVVSMLVAHLSPVGGVLDLSEYLTAPLFAVVIGVAMGLQLGRRHPGVIPFLVANVQRAMVLLVLGLVLQPLYGQVDVVLPYLGILVLVLAPMALVLHRAPVLVLGLAASLAVLGPLVSERARDAERLSGGRWPGIGADLVTWLASGDAYRLVSLLPMALAGLALAAVVVEASRGRRGWGVAGVLAVASLGSYLLGATSADGAAASSGSTAEVLGASFLATAVVVACFALTDAVTLSGDGVAARAAAPVLATGRLALTAYTAQILWLVLVSLVRGTGVADDSGLVLLSTGVVVIGGCWALERWWGTGPLEWLLHRIRPPVPEGRHRSA